MAPRLQRGSSRKHYLQSTLSYNVGSSENLLFHDKNNIGAALFWLDDMDLTSGISKNWVIDLIVLQSRILISRMTLYKLRNTCAAVSTSVPNNPFDQGVYVYGMANVISKNMTFTGNFDSGCSLSWKEYSLFRGPRSLNRCRRGESVSSLYQTDNIDMEQCKIICLLNGFGERSLCYCGKRNCLSWYGDHHFYKKVPERIDKSKKAIALWRNSIWPFKGHRCAIVVGETNKAEAIALYITPAGLESSSSTNELWCSLEMRAVSLQAAVNTVPDNETIKVLYDCIQSWPWRDNLRAGGLGLDFRRRRLLVNPESGYTCTVVRFFETLGELSSSGWPSTRDAVIVPSPLTPVTPTRVTLSLLSQAASRFGWSRFRCLGRSYQHDRCKSLGCGQ